MYNLGGLNLELDFKLMVKNGKSKKKENKTFPLLDAGVESRLTLENSVCENFLDRLQTDYNYELKQIAVNVKSDEFKVGSGWAKADIVVWKTVEDRETNASPFIVAQGKFQDGLRLEDYFEGIKFAKNCNTTLFVTVNSESANFYKLKDGSFFSIEEPKPNELKDNRKVEEALSHDENFKRDEFKKLLFACHNIIRNNDKFSPEMAFDEISKVMFVKINYERHNGLLTKSGLEQKRKEHQTYSVEPFYQVFFNATKEAFKNDEIFEDTDRFRIREESFFQIIEKLEKHNLAEIFDDVKGLAFEEFLGNTFRGDLGQFFTPRTVVDFMAEIIDPQESELIADPCCGSGGFLIKSFDLVKDAITDEITGVKLKFREQVFDKNFPKLSVEERKERLAKLDKAFADLNLELSPKFDGKTPEKQLVYVAESKKESRLYKLSNNCIYGTDAEPRSARTAKMNMIMRGDGHSGVHHHDGLLHINGMLRENFDIVLTNPPFGARISRELKISESDIQRDADKRKEYIDRYGQKYAAEREFLLENKTVSVLDLFDTGKEFLDKERDESEISDNKSKKKKEPNPLRSTLTEVLFMERCLDLLKKGGRMGIVLPEGFLNTMDLQSVREYFEGRAKLILIASIPQDVFIAAGATVKPSLVFLKRFTEAEEIEYKRVTDEVTDEINAKYQPQIDEITATRNALIVSLASLNGTLRTTKNDLRNKKGDEKKDIQTAITVIENRIKQARNDMNNGNKEYGKKIKEIEDRKRREIVQERKARFDYEIPIVQAEHAGVTSTGAKGKNDFPEIENEFCQYREMRVQANDPLWLSGQIEYEYTFDDFVLQRKLKLQTQPEKTDKKPRLKFSVKTDVTFS